MKIMKKTIRIAFSILLSSILFMPLVAQERIPVTVSASKQTIDGFGGSIAWYEGWLTAHPYKSTILDYLFKDLGISILRLRNDYMNEGGINQPMDDCAYIVQEANKRNPIDILITSWSPPGKYKSNGLPANNGTMATLATDSTGNFVYNGFANWWYQSLLQYQNRGINARYISIQNEPNFNPGYEGCIFMPQEQSVYDANLDSTYKVASYATAFSKVYDALDSNRANLNVFPRMIGPEVIGIENAWSGRPSDYTQYMDMTKCYAVAHHLYTGGDTSSANTFITNLSTIASKFPNIPKMQTEYSDGSWFFTALLMHNSLVYENVSAYLVWDLIWPDGAFINIENPWTPYSWKYPGKGFNVGKKYYVMKQFSAFVKPGWRRVDAVNNSSSAVRTSAFCSADGSKLTIVMINTSTTASQQVIPDPLYYQVSGGNVYRTSPTENCVLVGSYASGTMTLPPQSVTTLALQGSQNLAGYTMALVFPGNGQYMKADATTSELADNGGLILSSNYQYFLLTDAGNGLVGIKNTGTNAFVSCPADSSLHVTDSTASLGYNETFEMIWNSNGTLSFKSTATGRYLHMEGAPDFAGTQYLTSNSTTITAAEQFQYKVLSPVISITSPADSTTIQDSVFSISFTVNARDVDGLMSRVEYYAGDTRIGQTQTAPYSLTWKPVTPGNYTITAKAIDNYGFATLSRPIQLTLELVQTNQTGINTQTTGEGKASIYPNPFSTETLLSLPGTQRNEITITNLTGQVVYRQQVFGKQSCMIGSGLSGGLYLVHIRHDGKDEVLRMEKTGR